METAINVDICLFSFQKILIKIYMYLFLCLCVEMCGHATYVV